MSNNKEFATVGKPKIGGSIWRAPVGTTLPTTADGELDTAFIRRRERQLDRIGRDQVLGRRCCSAPQDVQNGLL